MTSNLICRVCLCTDKILREMDDELAEYFEDICDHNVRFHGLASAYSQSIFKDPLFGKVPTYLPGQLPSPTTNQITIPVGR